ncbi:N,N-dimethylformamidase beta subunit family domain-containing protein [Actinomycetospora sp. NBRC 106378]|uniref:N,N-dimethylformamidase beta subunit family domain-containing protein n=1 Tax=Actinomycetospora sp. NBRC 106378 TaxID=3032208 RepID=UPI0024A23FFF|nr:N,N-dimethylformamidase beta subunit family domain-containing protein [Actinomycetospora sp. NBRC 106378]GLZ51633.1 large subunit of N,N-dimethylformamidase [Actinomycetospora sp. NBRC 106378]
MRLLGYADRLSVPAGGQVAVHVSSEHAEVAVSLVRLRRGGSPRHHVDLVEEPVGSDLPPRIAGRVQRTCSGSFAAAEVRADLPDVGCALWFRPTAPTTEPRPLLVVGTLGLWCSAEALELRDGGSVLARLDVDAVRGRWAFAAATVDGQGRVRLTLHRPGLPDEAVGTTAVVAPVSGRLLLGSDGTVRPGLGATFNGGVARPVVSRAWTAEVTDALRAGADPLTLLDAAHTSVLDLAADPGGVRVPDRGGLTGGAAVHHLPARGVPGPFWSGAERDFRAAPAEFDALHLHDDDLADAGWDVDATWTVPADLPSGVYAVRLAAGDDVDRVPVVVTPARHTARVLLVLPTWTYLAYANWRTYAEYETERLGLYGEDRGIDDRDRWLAAHPEFGRSLYDVHSDGSGVCYSTRRRPILNLRPDYYTPTTRGFRHYAQDLLLLDWLERRGEDHAVVTDDEVEQQGTALLDRYRVVLTGGHPEYCSAGMLDAYAAYTATGGRLMYLGGNGFYQVTARHPGRPDALEIRRGHAGVATWVSDPGEEHLSATGEPGGLWRMRGRAPNRLVGVGFTAQGFDRGHGYRRSARSAEPDVSWVFDGVKAGIGEVVGAEGPGLGGAAADEFDRADVGLGTPPTAAVLGSSVGHSHKIGLAPEEIDHGYAAPPPGVHPNVRADLVLFGLPGGGAVFSVGSIGWSTAMSHDGGDNDTARITGTVLDRFRDHEGPVAP